MEKIKSVVADKALIVGLIGMVLLQSNTIPQTIKILKTGSVENLSIQMFVQTLLGLIMYLYNAVKTKNKLYIISNTIGIVNVTILIIAILTMGK